MLRLLSLLLCSLAFAAVCADEAMLLHWRLDEGNGVQIADSSPRKLNGRIVNAESVKWVEGRDGGKALEFLPGQNGKHPFVYVEEKDKELFSKGLTISVWVKLNPADYARASIWTIAASGRGNGYFDVMSYRYASVSVNNDYSYFVLPIIRGEVTEFIDPGITNSTSFGSYA